MNFRLSGVGFARVLLLGCASHQNQDDQGWSDPLEDFNRSMFNFNYNVLYPYVQPPSYGSFTPREDIGGLVDGSLSTLELSTTWWMSASKWPLEGLETRAQLLDSDGLLAGLLKIFTPWRAPPIASGMISWPAMRVDAAGESECRSDPRRS